MMPIAPLWSILFFLMVFTLGLDSQVTDLNILKHMVYRRKQSVTKSRSSLHNNLRVHLSSVHCAKKTSYFFQFAMMETVISAIVDEFTWLRKGKRKILFTLALCIALFFLGLPCCSRVSTNSLFA